MCILLHASHETELQIVNPERKNYNNTNTKCWNVTLDSYE